MNRKIKTAILIVSHNSKEMTTALCQKIERNVKCPYRLLVIETGSNKNELTDYSTLWVPDGIRGSRGFKKGWEYLSWMEQYHGEHYDTVWCCVNDAILKEEDFLTPLVNFIRITPDCGEIHPYFNPNSNNDCDQWKKNEGLARKESFCEIVCPVYSRKAMDIGLFEESFYYFWGIDYEQPYLIHKNNLRVYISNQIEVEHHGGTTAKSGKDGEFASLKQQYDTSRANMKEALVKKYGPNWARVFQDAIPSDVIHSQAFYHWVTRNGDFVF